MSLISLIPNGPPSMTWAATTLLIPRLGVTQLVFKGSTPMSEQENSIIWVEIPSPLTCRWKHLLPYDPGSFLFPGTSSLGFHHRPPLAAAAATWQCHFTPAAQHNHCNRLFPSRLQNFGNAYPFLPHRQHSYGTSAFPPLL